MKRSWEKRRFVEAAAMAILHGRAVSGQLVPMRDVVNRAIELWDELEAQVPEDKSDD